MQPKKWNQADGHLRPSFAPPKRLSFDSQLPEAESTMSSLDSERSCLMHRNSSAHAEDSTSLADCKYTVVALGKRSSAHRQQIAIDAEEECLKRSRIECSEAPMSGVTFQDVSDLHQAGILNAESDAVSVGMDVGACHDSVCVNSRSSKFVASRSKETVMDTHGIRRNDADKYVTYISSRVQESSSSMLSVARQATRDTCVSSISSCQQSRDGSHGNSRDTSSSYRVSDLSQTSSTHGRKSEAGAWGGLLSSKHVNRSPQISPAVSRRAPCISVDTTHLESQRTSFFNVGTMRSKCIPTEDTMRGHAAFFNADAMHGNDFSADTMHLKGSSVRSKESTPSYVLSSGRLCLEEEARLGRRLPTIDDDFEEYFSSLML